MPSDEGGGPVSDVASSSRFGGEVPLLLGGAVGGMRAASFSENYDHPIALHFRRRQTWLTLEEEQTDSS